MSDQLVSIKIERSTDSFARQVLEMARMGDYVEIRDALEG